MLSLLEVQESLSVVFGKRCGIRSWHGTEMSHSTESHRIDPSLGINKNMRASVSKEPKLQPRYLDNSVLVNGYLVEGCLLYVYVFARHPVPTTNGGMQNGSSFGKYYTLHTRFCTFAQSVLRNKIYASELCRKFVKSALLVGQ